MITNQTTHFVVGAGPVGTAVASQLAQDGVSVELISRSGKDPRIPGVTARALDASDPKVLSNALAGATVIFNCANPGAYTAWAREWPPLAKALLETAETHEALLVTASNLYGYGHPDGPMTQDSPLRPADHKGQLRSQMWAEAVAAHRAGRVRVTEARASDYIGPTLPPSGGLLAMYAESTLAGKTANVLASPDQPHTWTAIDDVAATLITLSRNETAWGSAWIVPSNPPRTVREVLTELNRACGLPAPRLRQIPRWVLRAGAPIVPMLREACGVLYQFDAPFVADGTRTSETFGIWPTPWQEIIDSTAPVWRERTSA